MPKTPKTVLWDNVLGLMTRQWGGENLNKLARDAGIGNGSAARIKAQENSTGLDIIEAIAALFKVEPWQLLLPGLDPAKPIKLPTDPERKKWLGVYDRVNARQRRKLLDMADEFLGDADEKEA